MSKAVLIMDMPESCRECPLELIKGQCAVNSEITKDNTIKPDWCPLRPMPEKAEKRKTDNVHDIIIKQGWNACIDELTAGSSEEG